MFVAPVWRSRLMAVLRRVAMTRGALPVRGGAVKRDVADPVQFVLDRPVTLQPRGEPGRWGGDRVGGGDEVDDLDGLLAVAGDGPPHLGDLRGAGEADPGRDCRDLDGAADAATVPGGGDPVGRDVRPGQVLELSLQGWRVALDGEHVVPARCRDGRGGVSLGVHRVHGHDYTVQVEQREQVSYTRD